MSTYKGKPCSVCARVDDGSDDRQLQPYGEADAIICYGCMMARPNGAQEYSDKFIAACQKATDADDARRTRRATRKAAQPAPERKPVAGWHYEIIDGVRFAVLHAGPLVAMVDTDGVTWFWSVRKLDSIDDYNWNSDIAATENAAQLAAEGALLAVRDEITRAVGR